MGVSVQICNQTESQPAELNQLVLNRALREADRNRRHHHGNGVIADQFCQKAG